MKIINLQTNKIHNPLGFQFDKVVLSYHVVETSSKFRESVRIEVSVDPSFQTMEHDTGWRADISGIGYELDIVLKPRTRYFWRVSVKGDAGDQCTSDLAWFETAKMDEEWKAQWITPDNLTTEAPVFVKTIRLSELPVKSVRAYFSGVGLYELYVNAEKAGNEYLTPGCNAYDQWIQYQTYEVSGLQPGDNEIRVMLGNGWYKGRIGFNHGGKKDQYGSDFELIGELVITYEDGTEEVVCTDESWQVADGHIGANNIYDGEVFDATKSCHYTAAKLSTQSLTSRLEARRSLPVVIHEQIAPVEILSCEDGSAILDFGQNIVGWVTFPVNEKTGTEINLRYAEILQDGDIYTGNLRTAQTRFTYISDGRQCDVRPHFTFYGFRYVKVSGITDMESLKQFRACFIYSDIKQISKLETPNPLVNQFISNVIRSQKDNFLDIPTDCPQRDERMGWTGDIQVFSSAACSNMDVYAFLSKYLYDVAIEQEKMDGAVPFIVPMFDVLEAGSCAWGDAATVIPWNMWLHYGDSSILKQQFYSMKAWVDYIQRQVSAQNSSEYLWDSGFHFGDWLAMDNEPHIKTFKGKTEDKFIASVYYHYSALIVSKSAGILGLNTEQEYYKILSEQVLTELRKEYLTANGKLALETQTAYILAIIFDIYPAEFMPRAAKELEAKLARDQFKITTGFVGTPYFCRALTKVGLNELAYKIFLSTEKPGWLYPVTQGATSIWERWDSVNDGVIHPDDSMNSLNHYALGSVIDWLYKDVCGFNPSEEHTGFRKAIIKPAPSYRLREVSLESDTAAGCYKVNWAITEEGAIELGVTVPFDCSAEIYLPDAGDFSRVTSSADVLAHTQQGKETVVSVNAGSYFFIYQPVRDYISHYGIDMPMRELLGNTATKAVLDKYISDVLALPFLGMLENESLVAISNKPFYKHDKQVLTDIHNEISSIVVQ
ncbi:alfa-L-rhamnosidase RamA [Vibrio sp. HA2012]|uniref:alpha-L-rhamnosidase n=1 Tax=Vibrio sp. HA2012 TaxID=1971595 RepID=UPI000C2C9E18|nr:alpha-L-rhamnosidase [Vibrio sp. HA2012]PJC87203.1 alfa-L-rhamnosidase RamA [Vibrio sp. HA2012]